MWQGCVLLIIVGGLVRNNPLTVIVDIPLHIVNQMLLQVILHKIFC